MPRGFSFPWTFVPSRFRSKITGRASEKRICTSSGPGSCPALYDSADISSSASCFQSCFIADTTRVNPEPIKTPRYQINFRATGTAGSLSQTWHSSRGCSKSSPGCPIHTQPGRLASFRPCFFKETVLPSKNISTHLRNMELSSRPQISSTTCPSGSSIRKLYFGR